MAASNAVADAGTIGFNKSFEEWKINLVKKAKTNWWNKLLPCGRSTLPLFHSSYLFLCMPLLSVFSQATNLGGDLGIGCSLEAGNGPFFKKVWEETTFQLLSYFINSHSHLNDFYLCHHMDPYLSQQHTGLQHTVLRPSQEVTRPKARFKPPSQPLTFLVGRICIQPWDSIPDKLQWKRLWSSVVDHCATIQPSQQLTWEVKIRFPAGGKIKSV